MGVEAQFRRRTCAFTEALTERFDVEQTAETKTRKRVPRGQRKKLIVEQAMQVFADKGFSAGTREIARELGVTQALLYRYFSSKEELIEAVFQRQLELGGDPPPASDLLNAGTPLDQRVRLFAGELLDVIRNDRIRLCLYAGLAGYGTRHLTRDQLVSDVIGPLVLAVRQDTGLPDFEARPISADEFDLGMILHGGLVCLAMRDLIYDAAPMTSEARSVELLASAWLTEARTRIAELHDDWDNQRPKPGRQPQIARAS